MQWAAEHTSSAALHFGSRLMLDLRAKFASLDHLGMTGFTTSMPRQRTLRHSYSAAVLPFRIKAACRQYG